MSVTGPGLCAVPVGCQRWREGRESYRPAGEPFVDTGRYAVEAIDEARAKAFVVTHHYAHTYPSARFRAGLWRSRPFAAPELVGVAVFSVPSSQAVVPRRTGLGPAAGVCLGRFVLLDACPANSESWFLKRALSLLREAKPEIEAVISYSDPVERRTRQGALVKPGHIGTIYQAMSAVYVGRAAPKTMVLAPDGTEVDHRMLTKLRCGDVGRDYAERELVRLGAPRRRCGEDARAYASRALEEGPFVRMRHPGNHTYLFAVTGRVKAGFLRRRWDRGLPYPKREGGGVGEAKGSWAFRVAPGQGDGAW